MGRQTRRAGSNPGRNKANQPPTGEGKAQSPTRGSVRALHKRSAGPLQAARNHPELNLGDSEDEAAWRSGPEKNPKRKKAGR